MNAARIRRLARDYREHLRNWEPRPITDLEWEIQKAKATGRMQQQDAAIRAGVGAHARLTVDMVRAGPLKTDVWTNMRTRDGIGRRLGKLSDLEMD